jgi:two-component system LytT family response regulator
MIVDDEAPGRANLRMAMAAHSGWTLVAECAIAAAARDALTAHDVDVILLDIQMPGGSGIVLAREISLLGEPPLIIFVTAYSEHAIDAFEVHALDYLLKPINDARLAQAVSHAEAMLRQRQRETYGVALRGYVHAGDTGTVGHINVRSVGRIEQIRVRDILWIASAGNYVELCLESRTVLHRMTLNRIEALFAEGEFVRVHRGAIVRRNQIASLASTGDGTWRLTLRCGATVPVSARYYGALKSSM